MDFLREALQRNRRILHLRDLLLLLLRTACLLLFGLALARPYWSHQGGLAGQQGPVHAVLVVDNSRSMGLQRLDGTLLDESRRKAFEFIDQLPIGSRISVVPLCGSEAAYSLDPYRSQEDAREALERIQIVDRAGTAAQAVDLAQEACQLAPDLPAKRVVFLGDQQLGNWPTGGLEESLSKLPELQVVHIGADSPENGWIADFRIQDGIADVETQTAFYVTVRYNGPEPKSNVQITLEVDGSAVASRNIDLEPGQSRELQFPYHFDVQAEPGRATFVPATVTLQADTLPGDRLLADNVRHLVVPVVAALPVVFVDQYGEKENPARNEYGETFRLRRLLAPVTTRGESSRQLVQIRHTTPDGLTRQMLEDARLVIIAGVATPGAAVPLLRDYVVQGGQLFIAAGGEFDPNAWNQAAWLDGAGVLPAPLKAELIGQSPEEVNGQLSPFQFQPDSLVHDYFRLEEVGEDELADLYQTPLFFKTAVVNLDEPLLKELRENETKRIQADREFWQSSAQQLEDWSRQEAQGNLPATADQERRAVLSQREELDPHWLLWKSTEYVAPTESLEQAVERHLPQVLGRFSRDQLPAFVQRPIGRGQVLFFSSSVYSSWNDLTKTNAALVFDRIFRFLLQDTLPRRNLEGIDQFTLPVDSGDRRISYAVIRPGETEPETLPAEALGGDTYGVTIRNITQAGHYRLTAARAVDPTAASSAEAVTEPDKLWEIPLAVNGPERESDLSAIDATELQKRLGNANYRWVEREENISLAGAQISLQNAWRWLLWLVLVALLAELLVLAWPMLRQPGRQAT